MKQAVWDMTIHTEEHPFGKPLGTREAEPTHEDYCFMCGCCLGCHGSEQGFMICQGRGGSMNEHCWFVDPEGNTLDDF